MKKRKFYRNINIEIIRSLISNNISGPLTILFIVFLIFSIGTSGTFISIKNLKNILNLTSLLSIMALGSSLVILIGSIDLSLEGIIAFSTMVCGLLIKNTITKFDLGFYVLIIFVFLGFIVGLFNGLLYVKLKIPSFIVTLGMWFITAGLALIVGDIAGKTAVISLMDPKLQHFANGNIFGIPNIAVLALLLVILIQTLQKRTAFGKCIYAVGDNEILASQAGVNVNRVKVLTFALAGSLYAIGAFFLVSKLQAASPLISKGYLFSSLTSVVIGGGLLSGGVGSAVRTFIGAMIVISIANGMILMDINPYIQDAIKGLVLIIAIALTIDRKKLGVVK
jgi:ribose transport system permease protein